MHAGFIARAPPAKIYAIEAQTQRPVLGTGKGLVKNSLNQRASRQIAVWISFHSPKLVDFWHIPQTKDRPTEKPILNGVVFPKL